ncbi:hypothetical protein P0136_07350 [Lentisphaerota bacterium ZTH]|nr:hypothetical protein JYG24_01535 [Lentisphaerota bacterium]WET05184.1 hypothetical protein P0136_07350 [Lentisphaerota bacterium ZTH]
MKVFKASVVAVAAVMLLAGCKSTETQKTKKLAEFKQTEEQKVKDIAFVYGDDIANGLKKGDYKLFVKNLTPEMQSKITESVFKKMKARMDKQLGDYQSKVFLTCLNNPLFRTYVWKATFKKEVTLKNKKTKKFDNQLLFRIVIGKIDNKYVVLGFGFQ